MKKTLILGLMLSLFTFSGSKEEVKTTHAAEADNSVTLPSGRLNLINSNDWDYANEITSIEFTNVQPTAEHEAIINLQAVEGGIIEAYIIPDAVWLGQYHCYIYADGKTICANANSSRMFENFSTLETVDFTNLNTEKVENMSYMFSECECLNTINFTNFNTTSVSDMSWMFNQCSSLSKVDLSSFNTSNVTSMLGMFMGCSQLSGLDFPSSFNTSNVESMSDMFHGCRMLTSLDLSMFNTLKVDDMSQMFSSCEKLAEVNLSSFETPNVKILYFMFSDCYALTSLDLSKFNTQNVTSMQSMFSDCNNLSSLILPNDPDTSNVTDMSYMFSNCSSLTKLDLSNWETNVVGNGYNTEGMSHIFAGCSSLKELYISSFDLSNIMDESYMANMLTECDNLECLYSPKTLPDEELLPSCAIDLPEKIVNSFGVNQLTSANLAENRVLDITANKFINEWKSLRDSNHSICDALIPGSAANNTLTKLLAQYEGFNGERQAFINNATDYGDVKIGDSIKYLQDVMDGNQSTETDYGYTNEDSASFITLSIKEESSYLVAVISLIGVLLVTGYYFYNKKKQAM